MDKKRVTLANKVIRSHSSLSLTSKRLLWLALSGIRHKEKILPSTRLVLTARDYQKLSGIKEEREAFRLLEEAATKLVSSIYYVQEDDDTLVKGHWVSDIVIHRDSREVDVYLGSLFCKFVSELAGNFSILYLTLAFSFKSRYTWAIYDLFNTYIKLGKVTKFEIGLDELRDVLGCPDSHEEFRVFNAHVLNVVVKELGELGVAEVRFEKKRTGRKVTGVGVRVEWL